jgi:hypothetical protein
VLGYLRDNARSTDSRGLGGAADSVVVAVEAMRVGLEYHEVAELDVAAVQVRRWRRDTHRRVRRVTRARVGVGFVDDRVVADIEGCGGAGVEQVANAAVLALVHVQVPARFGCDPIPEVAAHRWLMGGDPVRWVTATF